MKELNEQSNILLYTFKIQIFQIIQLF